jgi:hypothetical protein
LNESFRELKAETDRELRHCADELRKKTEEGSEIVCKIWNYWELFDQRWKSIWCNMMRKEEKARNIADRKITRARRIAEDFGERFDEGIGTEWAQYEKETADGIECTDADALVLVFRQLEKKFKSGIEKCRRRRTIFVIPAETER